jgi:hypothetical protein
MAEEVEHNIDSPTAADDDVMLDKESEYMMTRNQRRSQMRL